MSDQIARNWWVLALRGALAVILGIIAFVDLTVGLPVSVYPLGAYALLSGGFLLALAFRLRCRSQAIL